MDYIEKGAQRDANFIQPRQSSLARRIESVNKYKNIAAWITKPLSSKPSKCWWIFTKSARIVSSRKIMLKSTWYPKWIQFKLKPVYKYFINELFLFHNCSPSLQYILVDILSRVWWLLLNKRFETVISRTNEHLIRANTAGTVLLAD